MKYLKKNIVKKIMFLCVLFISFYAFVDGQSMPLEKKVEQLMELNFKEQDFNQMIEYGLELEKETIISVFGKRVFKEIKKDLTIESLDKMRSIVTQIYIKHFTEEEIDAMLQFYSSAIGNSILEKMPLVMLESMNNEQSKKWMFTLIDKTVARVQADQAKKFEINIKEDCSKFREGVFLSKSDRAEVLGEVTRRRDIQISVSIDGTLSHKFKIKWLSNNRYQLFPIDEKGEVHFDKKVLVNIYEVEGDKYKYICKAFLPNGEHLYSEGEGRIKNSGSL